MEKPTTFSAAAEEVLQNLKTGIAEWSSTVTQENIGEVIEVSEGIIQAGGLSEAGAGEQVLIEPKNFGENANNPYEPITGMVLNLEEDKAGIIVFGDYTKIKEGDLVRSTGKLFSVNVGKNFLGRVIDVLGNPLDGKGSIAPDTAYPLENPAPGVVDREGVETPLQTGITAIDGMIPIGRGQRELILGDRQTGKTALVLDAIINQKERGAVKPVVCIYVAIGQKEAKTARLVRTLAEHSALKYSIVVNAGAAQSAAHIYIAPYVGCTLGEYFRDHGQDALVIYDDLSKHAVAWRELSLLLRRPPGREAYPGDVFYLHSRLLERAAKLNQQKGGGSLTALPIIETQAGDISAYVPTNVISITDGQIFLESDLFHQGFKPAINVGLSVSRVGSNAQTHIMKKVSGRMKLDLAQFRELAAFAQFGSDMDPETKKKLDKGQRLMAILNQRQYDPLSIAEQAMVIYAGTRGFVDDVAVERIGEWHEQFLAYLRSSQRHLAEEINTNPKLTAEIEEKMQKVLRDFGEIFNATHEASAATEK